MEYVYRVLADNRGSVSTVAAIKVSFKQVLKNIQTVAVIAGFKVQWPELAKRVLDIAQSAVSVVNIHFGLSCMLPSIPGNTGSVVFSWVFPLVVAMAAMLAVPLSNLLHFVLCSDSLSMFCAVDVYHLFQQAFVCSEQQENSYAIVSQIPTLSKLR